MALARPCKRLKLLGPPLGPVAATLPHRPAPAQQASSRHYANGTPQTHQQPAGTSPQRSRLDRLLKQPKPIAPARKQPAQPPSAPAKTPKSPSNDKYLAEKGVDADANPVLARYLLAKKKEDEDAAAAAAPATGLTDRQAALERLQGSLDASSIFETDAPRLPKLPKPSSRKETQPAGPEAAAPQGRDAAAMAAYLDPEPTQRRLWERKMLIRDIRKRGRLTRAQLLVRTERFSLAKSDWWKTSVKKLGNLARQIQGKALPDALTQMQYSSKKAARDVHAHLLRARDAAVVRKGMGLAANQPVKVKIALKDGAEHVVRDKSAMYVAQAWVGRGPYGKQPDYRARGRTNVMRLPQTSLTVVLKEEATRIREHEERLEKARKRKLWVPLLDRPVPGQRQYFSW